MLRPPKFPPEGRITGADGREGKLGAEGRNCGKFGVVGRSCWGIGREPPPMIVCPEGGFPCELP
jgi:hypothetical protein